MGSAQPCGVDKRDVPNDRADGPCGCSRRSDLIERGCCHDSDLRQMVINPKRYPTAGQAHPLIGLHSCAIARAFRAPCVFGSRCQIPQESRYSL